MPILKARTGANVYFERLTTSTSKLNVSYCVQYYPIISELYPNSMKLIKKRCRDYDIVHSMPECGFPFKEKNIPLALTVHHLVFGSTYKKYTSLNQKAYHKFLFRYMDKSLSVADCIIAVSKSTKDDIERIFNISNVKVIHNGIDTEIFKPLDIDDPYPDKIKLLFVGNLTKRKGADLLPKIMEKLDERYILFYTSGLRTKKEFTNEKMVSLKKLSLSELVKMYNLSDILIAPSRLEGFGYSVAEAMACGKPVIATNCSSFPELIDQ